MFFLRVSHCLKPMRVTCCFYTQRELIVLPSLLNIIYFQYPINVTGTEKKRIIERTNKEYAFFDTEEGITQISNKKGEPCHFLAKDGVTCSIHDIKPAECKGYPLHFNRSGSLETPIVASACPASDFLTLSFIEEAIEELARLPISSRKQFFRTNILLGQWTEEC